MSMQGWTSIKLREGRWFIQDHTAGLLLQMFSVANTGELALAIKGGFIL